jgi:hypothetical protein
MHQNLTMINLDKKIRLILNRVNKYFFPVRRACLAGTFFMVISTTACKSRQLPAAGVITQPTSLDTGLYRYYDFAHPSIIILGHQLREISGIAYQQKDSSLLAENDEEGKLFTVSLKDPSPEHYPSAHFGKKDDYEDIAVVDSTAYLLISNGTVVAVPGFASSAAPKGHVLDQLAGTHNEFETLYYDPGLHSLIMLCKSCHHEKDAGRNAYRLDIGTGRFADSALYTINIAAIRKKLNDPAAKFFPSAAAIHPLQGNLYIVSSIGKLLVVAGTDGVVKEAWRLNPDYFRQPEGIAFAPNGDLFISNEGGDGDATIVRFSYQP